MISTYLKNIFSTLNRQVLSLIIGTLTSVLIARYLGIEQRGVYALIVLLPTTIVTFTNFGIDGAAIYYTGKKIYIFADMLKSLKILTILITVFSLLIGILIIVFYKEQFFASVPILLLFSGLFLIPAMIYNSFFQSLFIGYEQFTILNRILLIQPIIFLSFLLIAVIGNFRTEGILYSEIFSHYIGVFFTFYFLKKYFQNFSNHSTSVLKPLIWKKIKFGLKTHLTNILAFLDYRLDLFMVTYFLDVKAVGAYVIAVNIAEKLWILSTSVSSVMFARVVNMENGNDKSQLAASTAKVVFIISLAVGIVLYYAGEKLIILLFGHEYEASVLPFLYLLPGIVLGAVSRIYANYIGGQGKPEYNLYVVIFLVIENFILNFIWIPQMGLAGAALATTVAYATNFVLKIIVFKWMSKMSIVSILFPTQNEIKLLKQYLFQNRKIAE